MNLFLLGLLICCSFFVRSALADDARFSDTNARFRCGIRKKFGVQLIREAHTAELGQWPWHAALFYNQDYKCGGTLIDQLHVLTSAHCVVGANLRAKKPDNYTIHLGKNHLDEYSDRVQIVKVKEIHVYPEFQTNRHDIALLVLSQSVQYSECVIPICIDGIQAAKGEDLAEKRGWVAGFGETEKDKYSKILKTASMLVVNNTECVQSDPELFGRFMNSAIFCASDRNGTSVCRGDSGGGVYFLAGDRWELRGITSFAGMSEGGSCDDKKYVVFTSVAFYYGWIKKITGGNVVIVPNSISELKCREYSKFAAKRQNGVCYNSRSPHIVALIDINQRHISSGSIISERFILSKAPSLFDLFKPDVIWDDLWVRLGNQPDKRVIREISHPDYDQDTLRHQIILFEMESPVEFSNRLLPVCLANPNTENLYDSLLLNGFSGQTANTNDFYENPDNRIILNENCQKTVEMAGEQFTINKEELCSLYPYEGFIYWGGIVGGPLQTVNTRSCMFTQIGVTKSLIKQTKNITTVYSRITAYLDWIEKEVWGNLTTLPVDTTMIENGGEAPTIIEYDEQNEQTSATTTARTTTVRTQATSKATPKNLEDIIYFPDN